MEGKELDAEEAPVTHLKTMDPSEVYSGLYLQLDGIHSKAYYDSVNEQESNWESKDAEKEASMSKQEREAYRIANSPQFVPDSHIVPTDLTPPHRNFDVDNNIYNGLSMTSSYLQLSDHVNDQDDVVPEFSEEFKDHQEESIAEVKHFDFAGQ